MANPVNNKGISISAELGRAAKLDVQIGGSANVPENQGRDIFNNVNEAYAKNPNHARPHEFAQDAEGPRRDHGRAAGAADPPRADPPAARNAGRADPPKADPPKTAAHEPAVGEDAALVGRPQRGGPSKDPRVENGETVGRGPQRVGHGNGKGNGNGQTPPIIVPPTGDGGGGQTGKTVDTPPIIIMPTGQNDVPTGGFPRFPTIFTTRNGWQNGTGNPHGQPPLGVDVSLDLNLRAHNGQPAGVVRRVVDQILRQHDVYLSRSALNQLVGGQSNGRGAGATPTVSTGRANLPPGLQHAPGQNRAVPPGLQHAPGQNGGASSHAPASFARANLPGDVGRLVETVGARVLDLLADPRRQGDLIHQISKEIAHEIRDQVQAAKHSIVKNGELGAVHFKDLKAGEKLHVAVELLPPHLPDKARAELVQHRPQDVAAGLLLARGLVAPNAERPADVRQLVASKTTLLPGEVSMTQLRDVGNLVKGLIADTAAARTTANLDLAVQKFVKILVANNELGVLLATVSLAAQTQNQAGLVGRSLALAQIYELIARLVQAGEQAARAALPETAAKAAKGALPDGRSPLAAAGAARELDEPGGPQNRAALAEAAGALRQFLEFNPALALDNAASRFDNPEDARQAQKNFVNLYHDDIEQWLKSGDHRFVKDFDLDQPAGVVVERAHDGAFAASTARFVLVRDGSVQGWHFLKTFLVR